jgi:3-hydroxy-3-methylglutaryl CoA synthase
MNGIVSYGSYIPYFRLDRKTIGESLGSSAGKGTRAVASYDEDTTSMGVEAARAALRGAPRLAPAALYFATADPAYLDKTNATAIHAALDLDTSAMAFDMLGSIRSGSGVIRAAADASRPTLAVLSDIRTGLPGGADERDGGDAAVAFLFASGDGEHPVLAEPIGAGAATAEFLERWRVPGDPASRQWEERFGEHAYVPLAEVAITEALKQAGITAQALAHVVVAGSHGRANKRAAAGMGAKTGAFADDLTGTVGNAGTAHAALLFADALDRAQADDLIAVVTLADGCDVAWLPHARAAAPARSGAAGGAALAAGGGVEVRLHRQPLPGLRGAASAARARLPQVPRGGQDGARAHGRRARHHRDLYGGPPRLLALAAGGGGRPGLRGRRPFHLRAHRRGSGVGQDRRPGGDDLPPPDDRRRRAQLLLESSSPPRLEQEITSWPATASGTAWRSSAWAALPSASTGTRA